MKKRFQLSWESEKFAVFITDACRDHYGHGAPQQWKGKNTEERYRNKL